MVGMLLMSNHLSAQQRRLEEEKDEVGVLLADGPLERGESLKPTLLDYKLVDREDQPWSTIKFEDPELGPDADRRYQDMKTLLDGRVVKRDIEDGDLILWTDLEEPRRQRLSELFEGNRRAVSVEVNSASIMDGLLQPNDRVDVLATFPAGMTIQGGGQAEPHEKTMVILEDVTVMAQGGRTSSVVGPSRGSGRSTTMVLALAPEEALLLSHVQRGGATISLLLRPYVSEGAGDYDYREVSSPDVQESVQKLIERGGGR